MKRLALAAATLVLLTHPTLAAPWCATVSADVPDGHAPVYAAPFDNAPIIRELAAGEYIELNDNTCGHELDAERTILGTICAPPGSEFDPVEYIKSADVGAFLAPQNHKGWVSRRLLTRGDCIERANR